MQPEKTNLPDVRQVVAGWEQIHTQHDDLAFKVLERSRIESPITPEESTRVRRKADLYFLPLILVTCMFQFADKAAISAAAIIGLLTDLDLIVTVETKPKVVTDTSRFSTAAAMFWVGYVVGSYPLGLIAQRFNKRYVCSAIVFLWGITAMLSAVCVNYQGFWVERFFLGFLESSINPALLPAITTWYTKKEQALRTPLYNAAQALGLSVFSAVFYGTSFIGNPEHSWRYLFYIVGGITALWGVVLFFFLADSPVDAKFLNHRESRHIKLSHSLKALLDPRVALLCIMIWGSSSASAVSGAFSSIIVQSLFGQTPRSALLLNIPYGIFGVILNVLVGVISMRIPNSRTYVFCAMVCLTLVGAAMMWKVPLSERGALLAALYLIIAYSAAFAQVISLATTNVAGGSKKVAVTAIIFIASSTSNIASPYYFNKNQYPTYPDGFLAVMILQAMAFVAALLYRYICWKENKRRDALPPPIEDQAFQDLTDQENMAFRYTL